MLGSAHLLNDSLHHRRIRCIGNFTADEWFDLAPHDSHTATRVCFKCGENIIAEFSCRQSSSNNEIKLTVEQCN